MIMLLIKGSIQQALNAMKAHKVETSIGKTADTKNGETIIYCDDKYQAQVIKWYGENTTAPHPIGTLLFFNYANRPDPAIRAGVASSVKKKAGTMARFAKNPKNIPKFSMAADLLVAASIEWHLGNRQDALTLAAGAFSDKSMRGLAFAMHMTNNAAEAGLPIDEVLEKHGDTLYDDEPTKTEDEQYKELNEGDDVSNYLNEPGEENTSIKVEVSNVLRRIMAREDSDDDDFSGPGGDLPDGKDAATDLDEDAEEPADSKPGDFVDEDEDGLTVPEEEDDADPADPRALAEHPSSANTMELSEDELYDDNFTNEDEKDYHETPEDTVEVEPADLEEDRISDNLNKKFQRVYDEASTKPNGVPAAVRATMNRLSWRGQKVDHELAAEFAKTYRKSA